jgi:hypothetical protein
MESIMRGGLDLFTRRYLQIAMAIMIFTAIDKFAHFPHSSWIVISGIMSIMALIRQP